MKMGKLPWRGIRGVAVLGGLIAVSLFSRQVSVLKLYPLFINGGFFCAFGWTFFSPPVMAFRFATLKDTSIKGSLAEKRIEGYCKKVTLVWCGFFIVNGTTSLLTMLYASGAVWALYNGCVSYILMGLLFAGEFMVRKRTDKKMPKAIPLSQFLPGSREAGAVLCYEGAFSEGTYKTWRDFLDDTARLRHVIASEPQDKWLLHAEDCWYFLAAFTALLQCRKQVLLSANISPGYLADILDEDTAVLSDRELPGASNIADILSSPPQYAGEAAGPINADETVILMYTSGTTGKPKVVRQRLTEFEKDNAFILSKWGEEWLKRKVCSTVSQHHIYGLLFSIMLPFTAGVPFRRRRVEFPEELFALCTSTHDAYMIITVPAFLKRVAESDTEGFAGNAPFIYTSGGAVPPDLAEKTNRIFGFWPLEVYGSTETSGIAFRQSRNGMEWTVFDNAGISRNEDGCLVIRSPYIKAPEGFVTGDLVDILPDGRFLLKGRADSIVKVEEKRISLPEVENRLLQSGMVSDVCVIALEDRRQYLAAAVVLNAPGTARFAGVEKFDINRFFTEYLLRFFEPVCLPKKWRYVDALPLDAQGKKKQQDIKALFKRGEGTMMVYHEKLIEHSENRAVFELHFDENADYFDGHFPQVKVLPAVAQVDVALHLAEKYLGSGRLVSKMRRLKFSAIIGPDETVCLELIYDTEKQSLTFKMKKPNMDDVYSSGTICLCEGRIP